MIYKTTTVDDLLYLLACALNNQEADLARVLKMDLTKIFSLAELHNVASCATFALEDIGLDDGILKPWKQVKLMAIRKNILLNNEREQIYFYMENNSIRHVSLKGIIMQTLYPKFGMREMSDNDILYDSTYQEMMHEFMLAHGYRAEVYKSLHHDEYLKPPVYNFELHHLLFVRSQNEQIFDYYLNVMDKFLPVDGKKYELCFSDEDFYIYNVAHAYKHYCKSGTGLRILTDCYVYLNAKAETLDLTYIENECEKLGIAEYERICRSLSQKLFSPKSKPLTEKNNLTEAEKNMLNRIIISGAYGRQDLGVESKINKMVENEGDRNSIKAKYYFSRIFPSLEIIRDIYPFYYRHKFLIPWLWITRIAKALTVNRNRIKSELKAVDDTIANMKK